MTNQPSAKAYAFLKEHDLAVMASIDDKGRPHAATVYYFVDEDYQLYFMTKTGTRKYQNLLANPAVAVVVYDEAKLTTVQGEGSASEVADQAVQIEVMNKLAKLRGSEDKAWFPPIAQLKAGQYVLMKVTFDHLQVADFDKGQAQVDEVIS